MKSFIKEIRALIFLAGQALPIRVPLMLGMRKLRGVLGSYLQPAFINMSG